MEPPLLQLHDVSKSFAVVRALKRVSFSLRGGEVHALLGKTGAEKPTHKKITGGASAREGGGVKTDGTRHERLTPRAAHGLGIACIYQHPALFPELSVTENIALAL